MIHTVKTEDKTPIGKRLIKELRKHSKVVGFENPSANGIIPKGYVTGDEFENKVKEKILTLLIDVENNRINE